MNDWVWKRAVPENVQPRDGGYRIGGGFIGLLTDPDEVDHDAIIEALSAGQMVFGESMRIALIGFGLGLPLSLGVAHLLRSQLYQLNAFDTPSFTASLAITLLVSIGSAFLPACRAAQINPMDAIRSE